VIEAILPDGVAVAESFADPTDVHLFPEEVAAVAKAVDKRRREYSTVRHCARIAMAELGYAPAAVPTGPDREPVWPSGLVGSLTHCDGYRAAALALDSRLMAVGIDAEPHAPLPNGVLKTITRADELVRLDALAAEFPDTHWDRLVFSAKESVYKAWFPLARCWLGFEDASLVVEPASQTFTATLYKTGPDIGGRPLTSLSGRWRVHDGLVVTSVVVERPRS
jgi:4'-phosphopantetheinyl transferase EntD